MAILRHSVKVIWLNHLNLLKGISIDVGQIPDLGPILMVLGALAEGTTNYNASDLRIKESDRLNAMVTNLRLVQTGN